MTTRSLRRLVYRFVVAEMVGFGGFAAKALGFLLRVRSCVRRGGTCERLKECFGAVGGNSVGVAARGLDVDGCVAAGSRR